MFTTEVLAFYPKQEDVVYIDKTTISNQYLPQGVKTTDIIYAIDLTSDSEPDLIKISFCIKIDNDSGNCDYTGSKTYYKHNNEEWIVIANTQPM